MFSVQVTIEEWDGDGALRILDAALQALGLDRRRQPVHRSAPNQDSNPGLIEP